MPLPILIRGEGITACCCARLLRINGFAVTLSRTARAGIPAILVSGRSQALLHDVFGNGQLFRGMAPVHKRIVLWGAQPKPVIVPHMAIVVPEDVLLERMWSTVLTESDRTAETADWSIVTSSPTPPGTSECHFGSRTAFTSKVNLAPVAASEACWIESLKNGWLFLLGLGEGRGLLISVGDAPEALLGHSRLVADQVRGVEGAAGKFSAHPRILSQLCDSGWLACGPGAMTFDPLCGDGTGNAVRAAILASAAIHGIFRGFEANDVLAHYSLRLSGGFLRHLELCLNFYREARSGPWWDSEIALLQQGVEHMRKRIADIDGPPRFRLVDFELEEVIRSRTHFQ